MLTPFINYLSTFDPDLVGRFRGVSEDDVQRLASLYDRALPEIYLAFLKTMGADLGGMNLCGYARADFTTVYEHTVELREDGSFDELLRDCVVIGEGVSPGFDLCLDTRGSGDAAVVMADVEIGGTLARSLLHLLMQHVFVAYDLRSFPHLRTWGGAERQEKRDATDLAIRLGFSPLSFTDEHTWCGERAGAKIWISQLSNAPMAITVAAEEDATLKEIGPHLEQQLGLSTAKVHVLPDRYAPRHG